ncbi:GPSM2 [Bugula neritina]|uniref:GPSM2 n=2 Tax=Bugula neritina TaxID=10212 RepID=A0A7J7J970_BUGNE|nr:GPSM2 [Bugula neritina]
MEGSCLQLALEGERLCKSGDCINGVQFFEAAVKSGTDDLKVLSAIYSQLGNAYFYLQQYEKAFEFHKHDLTLTRYVVSLTHGVVSVILGYLCSHDLLYFLLGSHDPGEFPEQVREALMKAVEHYIINLDIVRELGDRPAEGRAAGNLGNTFYLLGNFAEAINYHQQRLAIGKEYGDKPAERRAYSNLGNAHIFLGEFEIAIEYYKKSLQLSKQLGDLALEAQACYSLGNTFTLLRDYQSAIQYHQRHLSIAQELQDKLGQGRAYWSLSNAHTALGNHQRAMHYAQLHLDISRDIGDEAGKAAASASLRDLQIAIGVTSTPNSDPLSKKRNSMDRLDIIQMSPISSENSNDEENFFDMLYKFQGRRLDDQRTSMRLTNGAASHKIEDTKKEQLMDIVAGVQGSRINDQRANFPGLRGNQRNVMSQLLSEGTAGRGGDVPDDNFFDQLMRCQSSRLEEQRTTLPRGEPSATGALRREFGQMSAPTVPDEDFFSMITKLQSNRLDEQRYEFRPDKDSKTGATSAASTSATRSSKTTHTKTTSSTSNKSSDKKKKK